MVPAKVNLPVFRGQTFRLSFYLREKDNKTTPFDLTGIDLVFLARQPNTSTPLVAFTKKKSTGGITYDTDTGEVSLEVDDSATEALSNKIAYLDYVLLFVYTDTSQDRLMEGRLELSDQKWVQP
jgi:hypothetical protein